MEPLSKARTTFQSRLSYDTALCFIPPRKTWDSIDSVRSSHDKVWPRWPPHINLVYPFVEQETLPAAVDILSQLPIASAPAGGLHLDLQAVDTFVRKRVNTVYARPVEGEGTRFLTEAASAIRLAMGLSLPSSFQPHMTMAQSQHIDSPEHQQLIDTARYALPLEWTTAELSILVRHQNGAMRLWGSINLSTRQTVRHETPQDFYSEPSLLQEHRGLGSETSISQPGHFFSQDTNAWLPTPVSAFSQKALVPKNRVIVASFNASDYSVDGQAKPTLLDHLLGDRAVADVLLLQGITSSILAVLLDNDGFRGCYPYCTHAPPPSNDAKSSATPGDIIILSKWALQWHELDLDLEVDGIGCLVATFPGVQFGISTVDNQALPLAVVACHFTCDTTDEAINSRAQAMQRIVGTMRSDYRHHAWIVGGDLGLTTSLRSIRQLRSSGSMSDHGQKTLLGFDRMLQDLEVQDAWMAIRLGMGESSDLGSEPWFESSLDEGEQAATSVTPANINDGGNTARPQRNARILLDRQSQIQPKGFNLFGFRQTGEPSVHSVHVSRHRGTRALLVPAPCQDDAQQMEKKTRIEFQRAPPRIASTGDLQSFLITQGLLLRSSERTPYVEALTTLERILLGSQTSAKRVTAGAAAVKLILATFGTAGLGVWFEGSTVSCLCVGNITPKTFFALATQRLKKELGREVSSLRRGRGSTGPKFELAIRGIRLDLHYCVATALAETWPEVMKRPSFDPVFALPFELMMPLKPLRDTSYLLKSIPDMTQYRLAHTAIRAWSKSRGVFDHTIGLLGDLHITALLVPVCKLIAFNGYNGSVGDLITTFFYHYSEFDWETQIAYDPFFHSKLGYRRGFREPICLLGWHPPALNTATGLTSSVVKTFAAELNLARKRLSDFEIKWSEFLKPSLQAPGLSAGSAAAEFLNRYETYIKVEARYWGPSPARFGRFIHRLKLQCAKTMLEIDKKLPSIRARIWPTAFIEESAVQQSMSRDHHVHYLIGLVSAASNSSRANAGEGVLSTILEDLERPMGRHYDANTCWIRAYVIESKELGSLRLDQTQGAMDSNTDEIDSDDCDPLSDDDEAEESMEKEGSQWRQVGGRDYEGGISGDERQSTGDAVIHPGEAMSLRLADPTCSSSAHAETETNRRLRSAADVINRLRWDPDLDVSDYVVGYVDRFRGTQEKLLEQWKSDQTDEDFIPQHRILYFRRREDGAVVWDRKLRIDKIFGSGGSVDHG